MPEPFDPKIEPRSFGLRLDHEGDEDHPPRPAGHEPAASPMSRHAAEWGLASLLTGGFLLLCTAIIVLFNLLFWDTGEHAVMTAAAWAQKLVIVGAVVTALVLMAVGAASLAMGIRCFSRPPGAASPPAWRRPARW